MSICFFGNGTVGIEVLAFLFRNNEDVSIVVLHDEENARDYGVKVIHDSDLHDSACLKLLKSMRLTYGISAFFDHIIRADVINVFARGIVNFHTSYLPWNRGSNPNVWSIINDDPVGVSIHYIDQNKILERAGVLIRWTDHVVDKGVCLESNESADAISRKIQNYIIFRHKVIYQNNTLHGT